MTTKKIILALTLAFIIAAGSGLALAKTDKTDKTDQPGEARRPPAADQMNPEDQAAITALWKDHQKKAAPLRDQMWAKRMEYEALAANPNTKPADLRPVIDDMLKLRTQLRTERESFFSQLEAKGYGPYGSDQLRRHFRGDGRGRRWDGGRFGGPCPGGRDWDDDGYDYGPRRHYMMDGRHGHGRQYFRHG